jgi:hypothetical protein
VLRFAAAAPLAFAVLAVLGCEEADCRDTKVRAFESTLVAGADGSVIAVVFGVPVDEHCNEQSGGDQRLYAVLPGGARAFRDLGDRPTMVEISSVTTGLLLQTHGPWADEVDREAFTLLDRTTLEPLGAATDLGGDRASVSASGRFLLSPTSQGWDIADLSDPTEVVAPAPLPALGSMVFWAKTSDRLHALTCEDALRFRVRSWDAEVLAAGDYPGAAELWAEPDIDREVERAQCRAYDPAAASPADDRLAVPVRVPLGEGVFDEAILLLDPTMGDGTTIASAKAPFAFSQDGRWLAAASAGEAPGVVITNTRTLERRVVPLPSPMTGLAFVGEDQVVVRAVGDGTGDGDTDSGTNVPHGRTERIDLSNGERLSLPRWIGRSPEAVIGGRLWYIGDWAGARILIAANLSTGSVAPIEIPSGEPDAMVPVAGGEEIAVLIRRNMEAKQAPVLAFFDANGRLLREVDLPVDPVLW